MEPSSCVKRVIRAVLPSERIARLVREKGWSGLTELQLEAYSAVTSGANVIITAPTGAGKTEAALLPVLDMIAESRAKPVSLLYITPAKALIDDLYERIKWWADRLGFRVARKHGDTGARERQERLRKAPHILITTPESLEIDLDWAPRFRVKYVNLSWVIVDEVHDLLSNKRGVQLALLLERLRKFTGRDFQVIAISATMADPLGALRILSGSSKRRRRTLVSAPSTKKVDVEVVVAGNGPASIADRVAENVEEPTLVFVNSRFMAEKLKALLEERLPGREIYVHHSSVSADLRKQAEEALKQGGGIVICTKTLELGVDLGKVKKVILVGSPGSPDALMQRIGRSGHTLQGEARGTVVALNLLDAAEAEAEARLAKKAVYTQRNVARAPLDVVAREVVGIIMERGAATPEDVYSSLSGSPIFTYTIEDIKSLMEYMASRGYLRRNGVAYKLGAGFYRIWSFNGRGRWSRAFTEFFTTINSGDSFKVEWNGKQVGSIDAYYVWRYLRPGDTIRLSGRSWKVKAIDENSLKVEVEPAESDAEIPLWRGSAIRRDKLVAAEALRILGSGWAPQGVDNSGLKTPLPGDSTAIYDRVEREDVILYPLGDGAAEALAIAVSYLVAKEEGLGVHYKYSYYGFTIRTGEPGNAVKALSWLAEDPETRLPEALKAGLLRSPLTVQIAREIQLPLGRQGGIDPLSEPDDLVVRESVRQVMEDLLDVEGALEFLLSVRDGELNIEKWRGPGYHPLALELVRSPPVRPWLPGLARRIASLLEGYALTAWEAADALELPEKTVEAKLKDMRKPEYGPLRTVAFIDVDGYETRWTLVESLEEVAGLEEFEESFKPRRLDDNYRVVFKRSRGEPGMEVILTPRIVIDEWSYIRDKLPREAYQLSVAHADFPDKELTVTFYNVPLQAARLLILNAMKVVERRLRDLFY